MRLEEILNNLIYAINHLGPLEIRILVVITAILVVFLVFRMFGPKVAAALLLLCLIGYILYLNNFFQVYENREAEKAEYNKVIEQELNK